jgi:hypothetical protein
MAGNSSLHKMRSYLYMGRVMYEPRNYESGIQLSKLTIRVRI